MNLIEPSSSAKKRDPSNTPKWNAIEAYPIDVNAKLIVSRIMKREPRCSTSHEDYPIVMRLWRYLALYIRSRELYPRRVNIKCANRQKLCTFPEWECLLRTFGIHSEYASMREEWRNIYSMHAAFEEAYFFPFYFIKSSFLLLITVNNYNKFDAKSFRNLKRFRYYLCQNYVTLGNNSLYLNLLTLFLITRCTSLINWHGYIAWN